MDLPIINYFNNRWVVKFVTTTISDIGVYDFRYKFDDVDKDTTGWLYHYNRINVLNNFPFVINIKYSSLNVIRTNSIIISINGSDIEDPENLLTCYIQYRSQTGSWTSLSGLQYKIDHWEVIFNPLKNFPLGYYDFRVRFKDNDNGYSNWIEDFDKILIKNNIPIFNDLKYSTYKIFRTNPLTIFINASDIETAENKLTCGIQYRSPSGNWKDITGETFVIDHWEGIFTASITAELGSYDFRVNFTDIDGNFSGWVEDLDKITIMNNLPSGNLSYSSTKVYRANSITIYANGIDIETGENQLTCEIQYRKPSGNWQNIIGETFVIDHWEGIFTPSITAELGSYDFRVNFTDVDGNFSGWIEDLDKITIMNNIPSGNLSYSSAKAYRTNSITIYANGIDIETGENQLTCEIQYKVSSGNWQNIIGETFVNDHWEGIFTPSSSAELGSYNFRVNFIDTDNNQSGWLESLDHILVLNNNPKLDTIDITSILEDEYYYISYKATDIETINLIWTYESNATWLFWDNKNYTLYGIPNNDDVGLYWVRINISDRDDGYDEHNFTITVINTNDAPKIIIQDLTLAIEDKFYEVIYIANDIDINEVLQWEYDTNANWLHWGLTNHTLYGTPNNNDIGKYWVKIKVTDNNGDYNEHNFILTVVNVNDPPTIIGAPETLEVIALENKSLDLTPYINDIDNKSTELKIQIQSQYARVTGFIITFNYPKFISWEKVPIIVSDGIDLSKPHYINITIQQKNITLPIIIEKFPVGSNIPIITNISITFNNPMNQSTVENAFSISPSIKGEFTWNSNKIIFNPNDDLSYNTKYTITIKRSAKDFNGNILKEIFSWNFTTEIEKKIEIDSDNDGYLDNNDAFLYDPTEWLDTDKDGIGNNADYDDDNDGISDIDELDLGTNPLLNDTDGDFYIDSDDDYPLNFTRWKKDISIKGIENSNWIWIMISITIIIIIIVLLIVFLSIRQNYLTQLKQSPQQRNYYNRDYESRYSKVIRRYPQPAERRNIPRKISPSRISNHPRTNRHSTRRSFNKKEIIKRYKGEELYDVTEFIEWDDEESEDISEYIEWD